MNDVSGLARLKAEVQYLQAQGISAIDAARLLGLLQRMEAEGGDSASEVARKSALAQIEIESFKGNVGEWLANASHAHATSLELFKSAIAASQNATRAAMAINGSAAVAVLAFLGHLVSIDSPAGLVPSIAPVLTSFVLGVVSATASIGMTYLAQFCYVEQTPRWTRGGHFATAIAMAAWLLSLAAFCKASFDVASVFSKMQ